MSICRSPPRDFYFWREDTEEAYHPNPQVSDLGPEVGGGGRGPRRPEVPFILHQRHLWLTLMVIVDYRNLWPSSPGDSGRWASGSWAFQNCLPVLTSFDKFGWSFFDLQKSSKSSTKNCIVFSAEVELEVVHSSSEVWGPNEALMRSSRLQGRSDEALLATEARRLRRELESLGPLLVI